MPEQMPATLRRFVPLLLALLVAACGGQVISTVFEDVGEATPETTPEASASADTGYTDAEQTALAIEGIELVFGDPRQREPDWYPRLHRHDDGTLDLYVEDGWLNVVVLLPDNPAGRTRAAVICRDIAPIAYDDNAERIGYTAVMIVAPSGGYLADCVVPDQP